MDKTEKITTAFTFADTLKTQLESYNGRLVRRLNALSAETAKNVEVRTKDTAPKRSGRFRRAITSGLKDHGAFGDTYAWYVKSPHYRRTHLLVHGHATRNGGRTRANGFLTEAIAAELPKFEERVSRAIKEAADDD